MCCFVVGLRLFSEHGGEFHDHINYICVTGICDLITLLRLFYVDQTILFLFVLIFLGKESHKLWEVVFMNMMTKQLQAYDAQVEIKIIILITSRINYR